jgi:hypothetical protein
MVDKARGGRTEADAPSPLELALLERLVARHLPGFRLDGLSVALRENTGHGRFTTFVDALEQPLVDGVYSSVLDIIDVDSLPLGAGFVAFVRGGQITLEIFIYDDGPWDGGEAGWRLRPIRSGT